MDGFLLKTFKRLRKEIPRRYKDLRTLTDELIVKFSEEEADSVDPEVYLKALLQSCETRNTRLMEIALDAFHYLLEHGQVGESFKSDSEEFKDKTPIGLVIEAVCKCADEFDENVQVQVIKALLTAITSLNCEVHGANLLLSVRACFHINLMSKNPVIKVTAKAALTQMIDVINQRMEINDSRGTIKPPIISSSDLTSEDGANEKNPSLLGQDLTLANPSSDQQEEKSLALSVKGEISTEQSVTASTANDGSSSPNPRNPNQNPTTSTGGGGGGGAVGSSTAEESFHSVYQRDAYLLFRALCKLSMKGMSEEGSLTAVNDSVMLQNKILSLELILSLLQNCGTAFRQGERFVYAVRNYLCVSLLSNCTSQVAQVTGLSLQIFLSLLASFKQHLKSEVEVFVSRIFIGILESENSSYDHKMKVLEVFHQLAKDSTAQTEIFVNYDCDLEATNLFSRMVTAFAKIAKNPNPNAGANPSNRLAVDFMASSNRKTAVEDLSLRTKGLEGLVFVLKSLMTSANLTLSPGSNTNPSSSNPNQEGEGGGGLSSIKEESNENNSDHPLSSSNPPSSHPSATLASEPSPNPNPSNPTSNPSIVEAFDKKQKLQEEIETGILRFNLSPMKGVKYLVGLGHLTLEARAVANFLHLYQEKLDKTAVGDLLGREKEYENGFCYAVLNEYVEAMDFSDLAFDQAIRYFLSGFRLPGEAQKIDRIMEKFAERYYLQHQTEFASADMAFILAFSTIMLQTNLHNPAIREDKRMTKEQFIKQNKGISSDGELSDSLLSEIYDRIAAEPIAINEDKKHYLAKKEENSSSGFVVFQSVTERKKKDAFNHERKEMLRASEAMIRQSKRKNSTFVSTSSSSASNENGLALGGLGLEEVYVRPMFEIVWPPVIGVISQLLETAEDPAIIDHCLTALHYSILLSCRLPDCSTARNTFIHALGKFTGLENSSAKEMKAKNLACVRLTLTLALAEGEYLEENWTQILQSISLLSRLLLFAHHGGGGHGGDDLFFSSDGGLGSLSNDSTSTSLTSHSHSGTSGKTPRRTSLLSGGNSRGLAPSLSTSSASNSHGNPNSGALGGLGDPLTKLFSGPSKAEVSRQLEEGNAELLSRVIDPVAIDKIFLSSTALSASAVIHFVRSLCDVSLLEITSHSGGNSSSSNPASPRIFSLQKLVEVADYNMTSRNRVDWASIWRLLANHFSLVGASDNPALAMFAIDSLKQLSIKFLQKEELSNFNFQRLFLKPFEIIITSPNTTEDIKDLVIRVIDIMIRACAPNIRSGWRSIFAIFEVVAGQQRSEEVASLAFEIIERLMTASFHLLVHDFVELMNCLVVFVASPHTTLSLRALTLLEKCAEHLSSGAVLPSHTHALAQHPSSGEGLDHHSSETGERGGSVDGKGSQLGADSSIFRLWWPLLLGLATKVSDSRGEVRTEALSTLRRILVNYGQIFSPQTWSVIFKGVLFPIIDSAKGDDDHHQSYPNHSPSHHNPNSERERWIETMAHEVFSLFKELFLRYLDNDRVVPIFSDLLTVFSSCLVGQDNLTLSSLAVKTLRDLLLTLGVEREGRKVLQRGHVDLIVKMLKNSLLKTLLFDFSPAIGKITIPPLSSSSSASANLAEGATLALLASLAPPSPSHNPNSRSASNTSSKIISTPYGSGPLIEMVPANPTLGLKTRAKIQLDWGIIYTASSSSDQSHLEEEEEADVPRHHDQGRSLSLPQVLMTMESQTSASCDLIKLVGQLFNSYKISFELEHCSSLLVGLEAAHYHAFLFNEDHNLRMNLMRAQNPTSNSYGRSFTMRKKIAHLMDQEVLSLECIIHIVFSLYFHSSSSTTSSNPRHDKGGEEGEEVEYSVAKHSKEDSEDFARQYLKRITCLVFTRYLTSEQPPLPPHLLKGITPSEVVDQKRGRDHVNENSEEEDEEDEGFVDNSSASGGLSLTGLRHDAYLSPLLMLLSNIEKFTEEKFQENQTWLILFLNKLILCQNLRVRSLLAAIYQKHVNPKFN